MKIETKFDIHDRVRIAELERTGRVISLWIIPKGIEYQVRYFDNGEARTVYFFEDELEIGVI